MTSSNEKVLNTTTSKDGSNKFLIEVKIEQLDSTGTPIEVWTLYNPQISRFNASELNYESDALSTYTLTIDYDWANLSEVP